MSVLVVGLSHHTAPITLLEQVSLDAEHVRKLMLDAVGRPRTTEAVVVSTCNRVEVYAVVERFHGGIEDLTNALCQHTGVAVADLVPHLFIRYEDAAIEHLFAVACGLDSMVVGETQILGQVKAGLQVAQDVGSAGPVLNGLFQHALRVGKRAHTETDLGRTGRSLVDAALAAASAVRTGRGSGPPRALVIGAGSMAALVAARLHHEHGADIQITNRTAARAERLAAEVGGRAVPSERLDEAIGAVDLVVTCTGATGVVLGYDLVRRALAGRGAAGRPGPLVIVDLAMPRDVDRAVDELAGATVVDLAGLGSAGRSGGVDRPDEVDQVRRLVVDEVAAVVAARRSGRVVPTVVALRDRAASVVETELERLAGRVPTLSPRARAEVEKTVRRVVDKLLHVPTVRVKELPAESVQISYAEALAELFALDPQAPEALEVPRGTDHQVDQTGPAGRTGQGEPGRLGEPDESGSRGQPDE